MARKKGTAAARIAELSEEIRRHNRLYYDEAKPEITDAEYDALFAELKKLEEEHPSFARPDSPTRSVGAAETARRPVRHALPLLSLDNTYSPEELTAFDARVRAAVPDARYSVEPKIDGVAVALTYVDGTLKLAATRGDGETGEDVTKNVLTIPELPPKLKRAGELAKGELHLRGEVYISKEHFAALVKRLIDEGETPFANPRNTAAGTLKLQDEEEVRGRRLGLFVHSFAGRVANHSELMDRLAKAGLPVVPGRRLYDSAEELVVDLPRYEAGRHAHPFETDGLVVKVDSARHREELGERSRSPRWAIAYKFPPEVAESTLLAIELQVGRTGVVTPVAKFEPVHLSGTTVSSATLHNEDEVKRLDLRVGDRVKVQKAGEIIPQVVGVVPAAKRGAPFRMPDACPACGSTLRQDEGKVKRRCVSSSCPATLRARLIHFASRGAMEIEGLGGATVDALIAAGLVKDAAGIYDLAVEQIAELPRQAEISARNLVNAIDASRRRPLHRLVFALGIPGVGESTARDLADSFGSLEALATATPERLLDVREVGETLAALITSFFADPAVRSLIEKLRKARVEAASAVIEKPAAGGAGPLAGKKVVVTGAVTGFDRRTIEEAIRAMGGLPQSSVSAKTDLLVLGSEPGSKYQKAQELGIEIMEGEKFRAIWEATSK